MSNKKSTLVTTEPGTELVFRRSSFEKDLEKRVLPMIDTQPIETKPSTDFSGAGFIFKRGDEDSGGYVALKLVPRDLTGNMDDVFAAL